MRHCKLTGKLHSIPKRKCLPCPMTSLFKISSTVSSVTMVRKTGGLTWSNMIYFRKYQGKWPMLGSWITFAQETVIRTFRRVIRPSPCWIHIFLPPRPPYVCSEKQWQCDSRKSRFHTDNATELARYTAAVLFIGAMCQLLKRDCTPTFRLLFNSQHNVLFITADNDVTVCF